jgi:hypothetical protein
MSLFNEVDIYSINIQVARNAIINLIIFSDPSSLEYELKEHYYNKYVDMQDDMNKYSFKYIGRFDTDSEYFDLACQALQYTVNYS